MAKKSARRDEAPHILVVPYSVPSSTSPTSSPYAARVSPLPSPSPRGTSPLAPLLSKSPSIRSLTLPFSDQGPPPLTSAPSLIMIALSSLHGPLLSWARARAHPRPVSAIVFDFFVGWNQPLAAELGVPRLVFSPSGVLGTAASYSLFVRMTWSPPPRRRRRLPSRVPLPSQLSGLPLEEALLAVQDVRRGRPSFGVRAAELPVEPRVVRAAELPVEPRELLVNSFEGLERAYLKRPLEDLAMKRVWAVGSVAPGLWEERERERLDFEEKREM